MRPRTLFAAALAASAVGHVLVAGLGREGNDRAQMAGAQATAVAVLGNSFEDLAAGSAAPARPGSGDPVEPDRPSRITPESAPAPREVEEADLAELSAASTAAPEAVAAHTAASARAPRASAGPQPPPSSASEVAPVAVPSQVEAVAADAVTKPTPDHNQRRPEANAVARTAPSADAPVRQPVVETQPTEIARAEPADRAAPARIEGRQPAAEAPRTSPRPQNRPARNPPERDVQQEPVRQARSTAQAAGNADHEARRGQADGAEEARTATPSSSGSAATAEVGTASLDNWRGQVLRKLQRQRKERVGARGTAMVRFSVGASGAITSVSVSRSSGSQRVDRTAIGHVQRAGPFPPPPGGHAVSLVVAFESRG